MISIRVKHLLWFGKTDHIVFINNYITYLNSIIYSSTLRIRDIVYTKKIREHSCTFQSSELHNL